MATYTIIQIGKLWAALFHCETITFLHTQYTPCDSKQEAIAQAERIITQYNKGA